MYSLRLYEDKILRGAVSEQVKSQHSIVYVVSGSVTLNGEEIEADHARYFADLGLIKAEREDAVIWRFELTRTAEPNAFLKGEDITSILKIERRVRMFDLSPRTNWLFRLDCIYDNLGSTGLHSHPGSGIRCLLEGNLHVRGAIGESSDSEKHGDCWYEEGSYPIVSTTYGDKPAAFLRGMILPVEYSKYPDTAMWIEGSKSVQSSWKSYEQQVVMLR